MVDLGNWSRLSAMPQVGLPDLVGIYASAADIAGSKFDPVSMGMRKSQDMIAEQQKTGQRVEIPQITAASLSVNDPQEVRLVSPQDVELAGSQFPDTHPDAWIKKLANDGLSLLMVGPLGPHQADTMEELLADMYLGALPTALYAYPDGVGVAGPS